MSLPLRITFERQDYTYTVLTRGINRQTDTIKISISGEEYNFVRNAANGWIALEETVGDRPGLLKAIARNIALRYRL